jgi:hypothetical protein
MQTGESAPTITKVPFARGFVVINDLAEAKKILSTEDDYVRGTLSFIFRFLLLAHGVMKPKLLLVVVAAAGLSVFDLQAKTQVDDHEVTVAQFMSHQAAQVLPFAEADVQVRPSPRSIFFFFLICLY